MVEKRRAVVNTILTNTGAFASAGENALLGCHPERQRKVSIGVYERFHLLAERFDCGRFAIRYCVVHYVL